MLGWRFIILLMVCGDLFDVRKIIFVFGWM